MDAKKTSVKGPGPRDQSGVLAAAALLLTLALPARPAEAERFLSPDLLGSPQVRRELRLPNTVSVKVLGFLNEAARLNRGGLMTREEAARLAVERTRSDPKALRRRALDLLTPSQQDRMEQIHLQMSAPFVLNSPALARRVGASPVQVERVQAVQKQEFERHQQRLRPLVDGHFRRAGQGAARRTARAHSRDRRMEALEREYLARCRAALLHVLTPAQEARWEALLGRPFDARQLTFDTASYSLD